ncbi:MAG TPA: hypothetical protein VNO21_25600, partial [Polyangiaceae bacterium]|nr:hypothetical protein [Polyangiaceae bacterium]
MSLRFVHGIGILVLAAVAFVTVAVIAPPSPKAANAPEADFSAARAMAHLETIARAPHPAGSRES